MENISEFAQTKSILNILGPIAGKIIELKETRYGLICDTEIVINLIRQCKNLELAAKSLENKILSETDTKICRSLKDLLLAIENIWESTKDLHRGDTKVKNIEVVWDQLIENFEIFLECLMKVVSVWEKSEFKKINLVLDEFFNAVLLLKTSNFTELTDLFQGISENFSVVYTIIKQRSEEVCRKNQSETLLINIDQLQMLLHFLAQIIGDYYVNCTSIDNSSFDFIIKRLEAIIAIIKKEISIGSDQYLLQEPGKYISSLHILFEKLSVNSENKAIDQLPVLEDIKVPLDVVENKAIDQLAVLEDIKVPLQVDENKAIDQLAVLEDIKVPLEVVIQHCICVAQCLNDEMKSRIMIACQKVLEETKILSEVEATKYSKNCDVEVLFPAICDVLENLEVEVNSSLVRLIIQTFTEPFSTLHDLLSEFKSTQPLDPKSIETLIQSFEENNDYFYHCAGFVIACIHDYKKIRAIESHLAMLNWLETEIISNILEHDAQMHELKINEIYFLSKEWVNIVSGLRKFIYDLIESNALIFVTQEIVSKTYEEIFVTENTEKLQKFTENTKKLQKIASKIISLITRILATNEGHEFLSVEQESDFRKAITEIEKYSNLFSEGVVSKRIFDGFSKKLKNLLEIFDFLVLSSIKIDVTDFDFFQENIIHSKSYLMLHDTQNELTNSYMVPKSSVNLCEDTANFYEKVANSCENTANICKNLQKSQENTANFYKNVAKSCENTGNTCNNSPIENDTKSRDSLFKSSKSVKNSCDNLPEHIAKYRENFARSSFQSIFRDKSSKNRISHEKTQSNDNIAGEKLEANEMGEKSEQLSRNFSIDITNFLNKSSFRSSSKKSKRNLSLKIKEIDLDIGEVIKITPKSKAPKYVSPLCDYLDENFDSFNEITGKAKKSTDNEI